jgi:hypothetical protein
MTRQASDILEAMRPASVEAGVRTYTAYANEYLGALDLGELLAVCRFFQTNVEDVTGHVVRYQSDRAKRLAQAAQKKGAVPCPSK